MLTNFFVRVNKLLVYVKYRLLSRMTKQRFWAAFGNMPCHNFFCGWNMVWRAVAGVEILFAFVVPVVLFCFFL